MAALMVATETFTTNRDGVPIVVHAQQTFLYDDDELVQRFPQFFRVSEQHARPEVEDASSAPGVKRGATARADASARVDER